MRKVIILLAAAALLAGCGDETQASPPASHGDAVVVTPIPMASSAPTPTPSPPVTPKPSPVALKPLLTKIGTHPCRYAFTLPKGAVLSYVRHSGPTYLYDGRVYWRLVVNGDLRVLDETPGPNRNYFPSLKDAPNGHYWKLKAHDWSTLVQRSPSDRYRWGVWACQG